MRENRGWPEQLKCLLEHKKGEKGSTIVIRREQAGSCTQSYFSSMNSHANTGPKYPGFAALDFSFELCANLAWEGVS